MNKHLLDLQLHQTAILLTPWQEANLSKRPSHGWVYAIRKALGITSVALSKKLGMTPAGLRKLESAEANDVITLGSLRKLASALDCELHYALVPKVTLDEMLTIRALQVASEQLAPISHSMSLEDQSTLKEKEIQIKLLSQEILRGSRRDLW